MCEMQYFFTYVLGFKGKQNKKATMGTIMHRALQILADKKLAQKTKKRKLKNDDLEDLTFAQCDDIEYITTLAFEHYSKLEPDLGLTEADLQTCISWVYKTILYKNGMYDPRNQNVFATEKFFDIEIKQDWAKYDYEVNGQKISGYLSIKGTVDLIIQEDEKYFQILDYKSGKRKDWATGKIKEYEDFQKDPQLLLYYYAIKNLYPEYSFYTSIFYVNDGGVFDLPFDESDYIKAESMLRQKFEYIKNVQIPKQVSANNTDFKCTKLCNFSELTENGDTICQAMHKEIKRDGIKKVTEKYADLKKITKYQDGGGRIAKD
jgi:hypothetical protein